MWEKVWEMEKWLLSLLICLNIEIFGGNYAPHLVAAASELWMISGLTLNDLLTRIYEPYPSVVAVFIIAMGAIQQAFIWFRFRFLACSLLAPSFFFYYFHTPRKPAQSLTCDANANVAAVAKYVPHTPRLSVGDSVRGCDLTQLLFFLFFYWFLSAFFMLIEMRQRRDIISQWFSCSLQTSTVSTVSVFLIHAIQLKHQPKIWLMTNLYKCVKHSYENRRLEAPSASSSPSSKIL